MEFNLAFKGLIFFSDMYFKVCKMTVTGQLEAHLEHVINEKITKDE